MLSAPRDPDFQIDNFPLFNLLCTASAYSEEMSSAIKQLDLDQSHWRILMLLADKSPSSVSELASRSVTKMSTVTRIILRMVDCGLVTRSVRPNDRRVTMVHLTQSAEQKLDRLQRVADRIYNRAMNGMSLQAAEQLTDSLKHIRHNLSQSQYLDS